MNGWPAIRSIMLVFFGSSVVCGRGGGGKEGAWHQVSREK